MQGNPIKSYGEGEGKSKTGSCHRYAAVSSAHKKRNSSDERAEGDENILKTSSWIIITLLLRILFLEFKSQAEGESFLLSLIPHSPPPLCGSVTRRREFFSVFLVIHGSLRIMETFLIHFQDAESGTGKRTTETRLTFNLPRCSSSETHQKKF